jgi:hypothetical protein
MVLIVKVIRDTQVAHGEVSLYHTSWYVRTFAAKLETGTEAGAEEQLLKSEFLISVLIFERGSS